MPECILPFRGPGILPVLILLMPRETPFTFSFPSPAEAITALLAHITPVDAAPIPLEQAAGRILAADVRSDRPSPPVDVSAMDGFALRLADIAAPDFPIAGEVRIGCEPPVLPLNACLRIVTGGAIPPGADIVVKREDTTEHAQRLAISPAAKSRLRSGEFIRRSGENLAAGSLVVSAGTPITPSVASALAAFGIAAPSAYRRVNIVVLTTGDELVSFNDTPTRWQLRDSNSIALRALLSPIPFVDCRHLHIRDDQSAMSDAIANALTSADALLLTGGVSMGHRDFVADALAANDVRTLFHGLPQRPGKPILGGITSDGRPVLALPGNPVSVMVTARRIAVPAILARAGAGGGTALQSQAPSQLQLTNPDAKPIDLWWHRPVRLTAPGHAELIDSKSSGDIAGAARADGFVELPPQATGPGPWPFYPWGF